MRRNFALTDVSEPELYRDQFPYSEIPRILFDSSDPQPNPAREIWITDTTFRDGQQARPPYAPEQVATIYDYLHRLGGPKGIIRQCEFFVYSKRDLQALELCQSRGYRYPEITSWIRADASDLALVRGLGLKETGILTSVSDYHIFLKLKKTRAKVMAEYLSVVRAALEAGLVPRCHFEDITRADIYGFVLPFAAELYKLADEFKRPVKIRLCDTMGFGVTYPGAVLPRSVPKLVHAFHSELGYPSEWLEWHGHNDFHKVHVNAATAWLYGCSSLNSTVLGFGERTGNPPLEAAVIEYISLRGNDDGIDTRIITEMAEYFQKEIGAPIPAGYPFVGADFNTTKAGIHADGILKNQEIYNIFDTGKLLNRPLRVQVTDKSGAAGIAAWLNENIPEIVEGKTAQVSKRQAGIKHIAAWIADEYAQGRTTSISAEEMVALAKRFLPGIFISDFDKAHEEAIRKAGMLAEYISNSEDVRSLDAERIENFLSEVVSRESSIQLLALTDLEGKRISQVYTQRGEKIMFRNLMNKDFRKHDWFMKVIETREPYDSDLFFSKYTGRLIMTAARPIFDTEGRMFAVMDIDFRFDELVKLINPLTDGLIERELAAYAPPVYEDGEAYEGPAPGVIGCDR
jgi:isopropylmalate/homocitrate/citramalate synthase